MKIVWHVTSPWLLGSALAISSLVLCHCLRCYRSRHNQDDITCQTIFMRGSSTGLHTNCVLQCTSCTPTARHSTYPNAFRQSRVPTVDLVSDLPIPLHTSSQGAGPGSENAASLMPDTLLGTVFLPTFTKSAGRFINSAL